MKSSLVGPQRTPSGTWGDCSLAVTRRPARRGRSWQPLPKGGCNLPAASTFPLAADCSPAELNGDLWFFLFLITGQPCLPDFSEAQTRFLPRSVSSRPAGPPQSGFPESPASSEPSIYLCFVPSKGIRLQGRTLR